MNTNNTIPQKVIAVCRPIGQKRRQALFHSIAQKGIEVIFVTASLSFPYKLLNILFSFHPSREIWKERSIKNTFFFSSMSRQIHKQLKKYNYDFDCIILHESLYGPGNILQSSKPFFIYEDSTPLLSMRYYPKWVPSTMRTKRYQKSISNLFFQASAIFTSSEATRKSFIMDYLLPEHRVYNVGQGCNITDDVIGCEHKDNSCYKILFSGTEFERKGGYILLEAFDMLIKKIPNAKLTIVGHSKLTRNSNINFLGNISFEQMKSLYRDTDIFALPSLYDPMPHVALEAMSCMVPIIISDRCGTAEIIQDRKNGFIVPCGNAKLLADTLEWAFNNPTQTRLIAKAGYELVKTKFNWSKVTDFIVDKISYYLASTSATKSRHSNHVLCK